MAKRKGDENKFTPPPVRSRRPVEKLMLSPKEPKAIALKKPKQGCLQSKFEETDLIQGSLSVEQSIEMEQALCIGVELSSEYKRCLLCNIKVISKFSFTAHLRDHGYEVGLA